MSQDRSTIRDFNSYFSSPDASLSPTITSGKYFFKFISFLKKNSKLIFLKIILIGDSPISADFFSLNQPRSSMIGRHSVPNFSSQIRQYAAQVSFFFLIYILWQNIFLIISLSFLC